MTSSPFCFRINFVRTLPWSCAACGAGARSRVSWVSSCHCPGFMVMAASRRVPRCQSGFWNLLIDRSSGAAFLGVVLRHERENQQQGPLVAPGEESRLPTLSVLLCRGSSSCFCSGHLRDGSLTLGHQLLRVSRRCLLGLRLLTLEPSTVLTDTSQPLPCLILLRLNMVV